MVHFGYRLAVGVPRELVRDAAMAILQQASFTRVLLHDRSFYVDLSWGFLTHVPASTSTYLGFLNARTCPYVDLS